MKEKSHRVSRRCYRSGVQALRGTHARRLDGYTGIAQVTFRFEGKGKPVVAAFDMPASSSDGGLVLLDRYPPRADQARRHRRERRAPAGGATWYAARKWKRRRVILKAEVVRHPGRPPQNTPRFV